MKNEVKFDYELYLRIRRSREMRNELAGETIYPTFADLYPENGKVFGHEWEGMELYDTQKDRNVTIESVHRHWHKGWYKMILFYTEYMHLGKVSRSHGTLFFENENCIDEIITEGIQENRNRYKLVK